ncbi:hypothetical protein PUN28_003068 [Cardiocondyla obscurior]|uniref:Uncharacterized protein n=1 Tax=Cardiocondyla obscurior TaxID=286306 RepID=A0AAW2GJ37_9HYME
MTLSIRDNGLESNACARASHSRYSRSFGSLLYCKFAIPLVIFAVNHCCTYVNVTKGATIVACLNPSNKSILKRCRKTLNSSSES